VRSGSGSRGSAKCSRRCPRSKSLQECKHPDARSGWWSWSRVGEHLKQCLPLLRYAVLRHH
jgi:hypothetical protein